MTNRAPLDMAYAMPYGSLVSKPRSRKEQIVSQVTITLPALHAHRWCTYLARRVHHATAAGGTARYLPAMRELHQLIYEITETKLPEYTINIPADLVQYARSYSYVERRLP